MHSREPVVPIEKLQCDRYLPGVDGARGGHRGLCDAIREDVRERITVLVLNKIDTRPGRPIGDWLCVQSRTWLVRRVPGSTGIRNVSGTDEAGDLQPLLIGESVEFGALDDGAVRAVEVLQV